MTSPAAFRDQANWSDGYYELAIEVGSGGDESSDWLDFYVPVGALTKAGLAYWDGRPFFRSAAMDEWPAAIGAKTFTSASFSLGVIGFEVSGCTDASTLAGVLPQTRDIGYLLPQGNVLHYGAANT